MSITTVTPLDENGELGEKDDTIVENKVVEYEDRDPNNLNEHLQVKCNQSSYKTVINSFFYSTVYTLYIETWPLGYVGWRHWWIWRFA